MAVRSPHILGSPVLRQKALPVAVDDDVRRLVDDLFETMQAARGVGLAANAHRPIEMGIGQAR